MKTILMLLWVLVLSACSYFISVDELARNIQHQMQREFNANTDYRHYRLTVVDVKIIERHGNDFKAVSTLQYQGQPFDIDVHIQQQDGGYNWILQEDAFAFIDEVELERYQRQLERELNQLTTALDQENLPEVELKEETSELIPPLQEFKSPPRVEPPIPVGNISAYTH